MAARKEIQVYVSHDMIEAAGYLFDLETDTEEPNYSVCDIHHQTTWCTVNSCYGSLQACRKLFPDNIFREVILCE